MTESVFVPGGAIESVSDRVTSQMRRAVVAGRLRPGQQFSPRTIARQMGVSYIPVREALRSLAAEGLLVIRPGRSPSPPPLEGDELEAVCRLRRRVEPELAARSATEIDGAHLDLLRSRLERCAVSLASPDLRYEEYHAVYFDLLGCSAAGWEMRVVHMLCRVVERYVRAGHGKIDYTARLPPEFVDSLRELIGAAATHDPDIIHARTAALVHRAGAVAHECLPDTTRAQ